MAQKHIKQIRSGNEAAEKWVDLFCDSCNLYNVMKPAVGFCVICAKYYCQNCCRDHNRSKQTKEHILLKDAEVTSDPKLFHTIKNSMFCSLHKETVISHICKDHDEYICLVCIATNHTKCDEVEKINSSPNYKQYLQETSRNLEELEKKALKILAEKEANLKDICNEKQAIDRQRLHRINELSAYVEKLAEDLKQKLDIKSTTEIQLIEQEIKECEEIKGCVENNKRLLETVLMYGNASNVSVINSTIAKSIEPWRKTLEEKEKKEKVHLRFVPNPLMKKLVNLGDIEVVHGKNKASPTHATSMYDVGSDEYNDPIETLSSKTVMGVNNMSCLDKMINQETSAIKILKNDAHQEAKLPSLQYQLPTFFSQFIKHYIDRSPCNIVTSVVFEDESIALLDDENNNIKVFSATFQFLSIVSFDESPSDMCLFNDNYFFVTFPDLKRINRYEITKDKSVIRYDRGFATSLCCYSIAPFDNEHVAILCSNITFYESVNSDDNTIMIQLRKVHNGQIVREIGEFVQINGETMTLYDPLIIRVISEKEILISGNDLLQCFEFSEGLDELKQKWFFKNSKKWYIDTISGVTVDKEGNIYACGTTSNNIHQISRYNFRNNRVLVGNLRNVLSVAVSKEKGLIIGYEECDFISVLRF